MYNMTCIV